MGRKVDVDNLVSVAEIADKLDVSRQLVHMWRERHTDFPKPIAELGGDLDKAKEQRRRKAGVLVFDWAEIEKWARSTGRYPPKPAAERE